MMIYLITKMISRVFLIYSINKDDMLIKYSKYDCLKSMFLKYFLHEGKKEHKL